MSQIIAHAPAKINLSLAVEPLQAGEDKHHLSSIFCTTTLADTLIFDFISGSEPFQIELEISAVDLDVSFIKCHDNTLTRSLEVFQSKYGTGFLPNGRLKIQLIKSIPTQSGLGGGSSNAAAMLRMLCWLAQVEPLSEKSLAVASAVGADVPFFLHAPKAGLCALMGNYGDELTEVLSKPELHLTIVKPQYGISTKKAFALFDNEIAESPHSPIVLVDTLNNNAQPAKIAALCSNNLEPIAIKLLPQLANIKTAMQAQPGVFAANLSGSGSALFAICQDANAARNCAEYFARQNLWAIATQT